MLFKLNEAKKVERPGFTAFVYSEKDAFPALNAVFVECKSGHERVFVAGSYRVYFVLSGAGVFEVGEERHEVSSRDVIAIPPNTKYSYEGKMGLFEVNFPATGPEDEIKVG